MARVAKAAIAADFVADHPSVQPFKLSQPAFLARHFASSPNKTNACVPLPGFIATGAIVFNRPKSNGSEAVPRVLLVQRAAHDSKPLRWESPGGGCDDDDESILHACARELREETGLSAYSIGPLASLQSDDSNSLGGQLFRSRKGKLVCKFYFMVDVRGTPDEAVTLDPNEHANFVWATEEEAVANRMKDGTVLEFTTDEQLQVVLDAFKFGRARPVL